MEYSPEAGESILRGRTQFNLPNQTRWQKCSSYRNPKLRVPAPNMLYPHAFYTEGADVASRRPGASPHTVSIRYVNGQSCGLTEPQAAGGSGGRLRTVASDQTQFRVHCPPERILFVTRVTAHVLWGGFIFLRIVSNLIHTPPCQVNIIRPLNR